jgi:5-formyltetrahydrofolate cyclo-ligase
MHKWSCNLQNKITLRQLLLSNRKTIPPEERKKAAQQAVLLFLASPLCHKGEHIACYFAQPYEFDCAPLIHALWAAGKQVYLPILMSNQENRLSFAKYRSTDALRLNKFQIEEPDHTELFPVEKLNVVIMPLVGFDMQGRRLGMGGGFYDRTFEWVNDSAVLRKPILCGIGFESQKVPELPQEPWDVLMNNVLTEKTIYSFEPHSL